MFDSRKFVQWLQVQINERRVRESSLTAVPFVLAAALVGLLAVAYAKLFLLAENWIRNLYSVKPLWAFVGSPLAFLAGWWLVSKFAPAAGGSGIPQLMAAAEMAEGKEHDRVHALMGLRILVVKVLSSTACLLGGGAIGREGPTLQLAGSTFYLTHRLLKKKMARYLPVPSLQSMIIAGGAAGLSAAFNTPLGGIVYAIEELAKVHLSYFRTSLIQAVIVSGLVSQLILGPYLYLGYPNVERAEVSQLPWIIILSAVIGIAGGLTGKALYAVSQWRSSSGSKTRQALIAAGMGLAFATLIYFFGTVGVGTGKDVLMDLLFTTHRTADWTWPVSRFIGNFLSYGSGSAGGIFAPALTTGATLGSLFSSFLPQFDPHLLVLMGMTAFLTGVTRTPFTSFVLVLEMTDRHAVIFTMMVGAMSANAAAHLIESLSLYEKIKENYLPHHEAAKVEALAASPSDITGS